MKALIAITLSAGLFSSNAQALDYFAIDMQGNVFQSDVGVYYAKYGMSQTTMDNVLLLDKTNNQMQVLGRTFSPNTNLFTVSDIQDVTYTSYYNVFNNGYLTPAGYAFVKANDTSYTIDMQGNVSQLGADYYYAKYGMSGTTMDNVLLLDKTNNQMQVLGRTFSPNTNLFTVSDIQDVTYTSYFNVFNNGYLTPAGYAFVKVNDTSYTIDMQGNVSQLGADYYYAKYGMSGTTMDNVLLLDKANNQMQVLGRTFSLNTDLFTVSDIQDVTYTSYYNVYNNNGYLTPAGFAYVAVNLSPAPEPETYAMLLAGLGLLGITARRRKQTV